MTELPRTSSASNSAVSTLNTTNTPINDFQVDPANLASADTPVPLPKSANHASIQSPRSTRDIPAWLAYLVLVGILIIGAYFRFVGINWDNNQHLHPDERFMTTVADNIRPADPFNYFDTETSTLNPIPYGSYTYGMFPLFLTRYTAELIQQTGYDKIVIVGRALSGTFDLLAVLMLFVLATRMYSRRVALLAAGLYAAAVLPIQLSHYFTVDSFATVFILAAFLVAVPIMEKGQRWHYAVFGLLTGLAMASKINTAPLAGVVGLAATVRLIKGWPNQRNRRAIFQEVILGLLIAGGVTALIFRIFQPYAFNGPSIFGISFNQRWLDIMREVTEQVAGQADYPPNHHWTNRSQLTYAWIQNSVWGLGLPLGSAATLGWIWATWRVWREANLEPTAKQEWQSHLLLIVWVGGYFAWQNAQFWRYMRYFMPVYPLAVLLGAWALIELFDHFRSRQAQTIRQLRQATLLRSFAVLLLAAVTIVTYGYAFAFTRIYTQPHSRVAASEWMLRTIPGPLNLQIQTTAGPQNQPLAVPYNLVLKPGEPWQTQFEPMAAGSLGEISAFKLAPPEATLRIKISRDEAGNDIVYDGRDTPLAIHNANQPYGVYLTSINLSGNQTYFLHYTLRSTLGFTADQLAIANGSQEVLSITGQIVVADALADINEVSGKLAFTPTDDLTLDRLQIGSIQWNLVAAPSVVRLTLARDATSHDPIATAESTVNYFETAAPTKFTFSPVTIEPGRTYFLSLEVISGLPLHPSGASLAMETSWDDSLPLRVDKFDPFGGIYLNKNLELFEPDTALKRDRIVDLLTTSDYLVISSNRAYDAMPRLPLRYPLTLKYYQALFNCSEQFIFTCAYPAQVGLRSTFGYELIAVFESNPNIGPFEFSDQTAEEAFTVYDHPKVMIFKRASDYSTETLSQTLNMVDLAQILDQAPRNYTAMPTALRLPPDRAAAQLQNGTWSDMFDPLSLFNSNQVYGVVAWYLLLGIIGWAAWPIVFLALRGLPDRGYPFAKLIGLLFVTWLAWFASSYKLVMFTQPTLWVVVTLVILNSVFVATRHWNSLVTFTTRNWRHLAIVETLTLGLFLFFLWVRWLNPDLWHPWLGGEKPADFSFFQSAIRSVYFPAYDPWLSDHYVNYYYYGFVVSAVLTKLLGILPSIAYNLALPTLFAFAGIGAFSVAFNLVAAESRRAATNTSRLFDIQTVITPQPKSAYLAGVAAMIMMILLGNLYQIRLLWQYLPEAADPPSAYSTDLSLQLPNVVDGAWRVISNQTSLPGDKGRWYFGSSRAIRRDGLDTPITEFPLFSFLYGDLHPHLTNMSIMLAALAWMISFVLAADSSRSPSTPSPPESAPKSGQHLTQTIIPMATWFTSGIVFGALLPTQTWDFPGFLILGVGAILSAAWLSQRTISRPIILRVALQVAVFASLAIGLYYPFRQWFATDYTSIEIWRGARTPFVDYLSVHGLFLFILISYLVWQSRQWPSAVRAKIPTNYLLNTPLGALLPRIRFPLLLIIIASVTLVGLGFGMSLNDYEAVLFASPLAVWVAILLFLPNQSLPQRLWSAIFGVGLGLTILVEFVTLKGDLGRSNTVFKFYIEVWLFFSVAAGVALAWLLPVIWRQWSEQPRRWWLGGFATLVAVAGIYTVSGIYSKVTDRWPGIDLPPRTLDGMAYMLGSDPSVPADIAQSAIYDDEGSRYILSNDYNAIVWLLKNVSGTPRIVEGNTPLYRWGSRFAIYTGLPTVIGWDWHVKQHNSILPSSVVDNRIADVRNFYNTTDPEKALTFINKYQVQYIIVGALERKYYNAEGLAKFQEMQANGQIQLVYPTTAESSEDITYIYQTAPIQNSSNN